MPKPSIFEIWGGRHVKPPLGRCQRWRIVDGKAQVCGRKADRQTCDECKAEMKPPVKGTKL